VTLANPEPIFAVRILSATRGPWPAPTEAYRGASSESAGSTTLNQVTVDRALHRAGRVRPAHLQRLVSAWSEMAQSS